MAIQFPNSPGIGSVFTDTDAGFSYEWTGVVWKSFTPAASSNVRELDDISSSFDNSTTTFNLTIGGAAYQPRSAAMLQISLGGVIQEPSTDYTISTSTITFTTAPNAGLDFFGVVRGTAVAIDYANNGNVQTKQEFTATEGQTSFTVTGGYTQGYVDVFRNGIRLGSDDFTDTSGTAIVLTVPAQADDLIEVVKYNVASIVVSQGEFTNLNVSGIVTASSFEGDGSSLTGIDATSLKDSGGNIKAQANPGGVVITGIATATGFKVGAAISVSDGAVSATRFHGDGSNLTGIDATSLKDSGGNVKAQANPGGVVITGVATATTFVGNLTGDVTGDVTGNTSGTAGGLTGTPNITVGSVTATGNVSIAGTLTYQDVTNVDSIGIITARSGIIVTAGVSTFGGNVVPDGNGTRDLGATAQRWANLYTSDLDLSNEARGGNDIDGTWGSYTIQEGENDLYLINRRTGKTFKFVLEEIN